MNNISEQLLSAVDIIVKDALSKTKNDQTIQASIFSLVNLDTGEYKIKYDGNIFSAFAASPGIQYKENDNVYVTIPQGDFSNKKIIVSKIKSESLAYSELVSLNNQYVVKGQSVSSMYNQDWTFNNGEASVVAGAKPDENYYSFEIYSGLREENQGLFSQYARTNNQIKIQAEFLTQFFNAHNHGNYGLEIIFFAQGGEEVTYKLDFGSFIGDPYRYKVWSPQSIIIDVQEGFLVGLKSITLFQEDFDYDRRVEFGLPIDGEEGQIKDVPNIKVRNVDIFFVEKKDLVNNLYYLDIETPLGTFFSTDVASIDLQPRLIHEGNNIFSLDTCTYKWFKRNLSVTLGHEKYNKDAGVGWQEINFDEEDYLSISNVNGLVTIQKEEVRYQKDYKLIVIYNESVVMTDEITIINLDSEYSFHIEQDTQESSIYLQIINDKENEFLIGDWYLSYPDGSYSLITKSKNRIDTTKLLLYSAVRFYCQVYTENDCEILGVLTYTINSSESQSDVTISYIGEDSFRYDANGDVTIEDAEKERTLQVALAWKEGTGTSYTVDWIGPDGQILDKDAQRDGMYNPEQSMIQNLWVDSDSILHYTIKQKYKISYNNNTIIVRIKTIDEKIYDFPKEILFLKDGDQGTNGDTYVTAIRPYDIESGLKVSGFKPLIYRDEQWVNNLPLKCYVYKDGELINNNEKYDIEYKWSVENVLLSGVEPNTKVDIDHVVVSGQSTVPASSLIKVEVIIDDKMNSKKYSIYTSYPIDAVYNFTDEEINTISIDSIPSYIKYTSSGTNAQYYNNNIVFKYQGNDLTENIKSLTPDILEITQSIDGNYSLKPATNYKCEQDGMALLQCSIDDDSYILHTVIMYLDNYGNEAINGWDGTKLVTNQEGTAYVFAPQVGAGTKDSANRFSGVVMGQDSGAIDPVTGKTLTGLYGYQQGNNTFGLMENGVAYFGVSGKGRITIDGNEGIIEGGGGGDSENGMTIWLANTDRKNLAIKIGKGKFSVDYEGNAYIDGEVKARKGYIGWKDKQTNNDGTISPAIEGWTIESGQISCGSGSRYVALNAVNPNDYPYVEEASYAFWCGSGNPSSAKFYVKKDGTMKCTDATIKGSITADYLECRNGTIGDFTITRSGLSGGSIYCDYLEANVGGEIGGWSIGSNTLRAGSTVLSATGKITCSSFELKGTDTTITEDGIVTNEINLTNGGRFGTGVSQTGRNSLEITFGTSYIEMASGSMAIRADNLYLYDSAHGNVGYNINMLLQARFA